jgi:hypothetical protein
VLHTKEVVSGCILRVSAQAEVVSADGGVVTGPRFHHVKLRPLRSVRVLPVAQQHQLAIQWAHATDQELGLEREHCGHNTGWLTDIYETIML